MPAELRVLPPLDALDLDLLFGAMIRLPAFFREANQHIQPDHFPFVERAYALLYIALRRLNSDGSPIVEASLSHAFARLVEQEGASSVQPDQAAAVLALIGRVCALPAAAYDLDYCRDQLRRFLDERAFRLPLVRAANAGTTADELSARLDELQHKRRHFATARQLPSLLAPAFGAAMPPASIYHPTGIPLIDDQLGGQREGDVNGILAFQGAGKTLLSGQIIVESARLAAAAGDTAGWSVLLTVEEPATRAMPRLLSCAAGVDRRKLSRYAWGEFTRADGPREDYERHQSAGERERYEAATAWFNRAVCILDLSGSTDHPTAGTGGVGEIADMLDRLTQATGRGIRTVAVDWAQPLVERAMPAGREDAVTRHLAALGDQLRRQVAERFAATVWIAHQLRSELATAKHAAATVADHTDAMACKGFAMHMSSCLVMSAPEPAGSPTDPDALAKAGIRRARWRKHRDAPDDAIRTVLLRPNPLIARFDPVTDFSVDPGGNLMPVDSRSTVPVTPRRGV